jgi:hypothetical protein
VSPEELDAIEARADDLPKSDADEDVWIGNAMDDIAALLAEVRRLREVEELCRSATRCEFRARVSASKCERGSRAR